MFKYLAGLSQGDARKPFKELVDRGIRFEVFKQRRHGNACAAKHPRTAHAFGVLFNGWAGGPIDHG